MPVGKKRRAELASSLHKGIFGFDMPASLALDAFDDMVEVAYINTMWFWFDNILPTNFEAGAAARRKYPPTPRRYGLYKWKLTQRDSMSRPRFVISGPAGPKNRHSPNWKEDITRRPERAPRVKRTRNGMVASIVVRVPLYVRQNRKIPNMARLATYLTREDHAAMDAHFESFLARALDYSVGSASRSA